MCVDMGKLPSTNCLHLMKEADSAVSEHTIKVRKPYTITKQRERWTEEEHNKFLEALKLYGRAWRRIEEHVGSKTTIQIRSHAQKFFSKVTRESMGDCSGIVNAMEIPPPRPKKRPRHPYPRKLCNQSYNKGPAVGWPLLPCIPNVSNSVQETKSPTSVLSAVGSDTIRTTSSDSPKTCVSPASSAGRSCMVDIPTEQESGFKSCFELSEDMPMMEQVVSNEDTVASKDDSTTKKVSSLKLFGKIVTLTELQQQCLSDKNVLEEKKSFSDIPEKKSLDTYLCTDNSRRDSCSGGMLHDISSAEANMVLIPFWWSLYGGMPFPFSSPMATIFDQSQSSHSIDGQFVDKEKTAVESFQTGCNTNDVGSSATDSKSGYVLPNNGRQKSSLQWKPSKNSAFSKLRPTSNSTRGFVPYKRCGVEKRLSIVKVACGKGGN